MKPLRIGTRASPLALWQAHHVRARLAQSHGLKAEIVAIRTSGDRLQSAPAQTIGAEADANGIFIKEIEQALLSGGVDIAVHSMKDLPTKIPAGLSLAAITAREDPRDCLISAAGVGLDQLPRGARIGTGSLRRQAQLRHYRPDLEIAPLRGNVETRLKKLASGSFEAIVLALAGLARLGLADRLTEILDPRIMLPAVGQGALGIEIRAGDPALASCVVALDDPISRACISAERALLAALQGGCQVPLGAWARLAADGATLHLEAAVLSPDGGECLRRELAGPLSQPESLGRRLAQNLLESGADRILRLAGRTLGRVS